MTDVNGEVNFTTVFPGWYSGRVAHIHFQVFLSSVLQATSQLTFPETEKNALYAANPPYSTYGPDPTAISADNVFSDGYTVQLATLTGNPTDGYDVYLEVTISGSGVTGLQNLEPETGGQFKLKQNFPNPYSEETTIPFTLANQSDVTIELWDLTGRKMASILNTEMSAGEQTVTLNMKSLGLPVGNYVYQIQVENKNGIFRQCKLMSAL
ncbi:MAG: T9SS type A sorting domain-containing protein [Bacteroidota bacterium]